MAYSITWYILTEPNRQNQKTEKIIMDLTVKLNRTKLGVHEQEQPIF
jgi:hypothetical protein